MKIRIGDLLDGLATFYPYAPKSKFSVICVPSLRNASASRRMRLLATVRSWFSRLMLSRSIDFDDLPGDGERRVLRRVVNVAVAGIAELLVLLGEEPPAQFRGEPVARLDANRVIVRGEGRVLVKPFPKDAETNFTGRHRSEERRVGKECRL